MTRLLCTLICFICSQTVFAKLQTETVTYQANNETYIGYLAYDDKFKGPRPGILVVHEWWGLNEYVRMRTEMLAELGYTALAVDMYGNGKTATHPEDAAAFSQTVASDPKGATKRFRVASKILRQHKTVEANNIAAIGYCFGGGVVLNMARFGFNLKGVVSFHGSLSPISEDKNKKIKAKILVLTGEADPFVPADQVNAFAQEMDASNADYEIVSYKDAKHSFTSPDADAIGQQFNIPLAYDAFADEDSWHRMQLFLRDALK